MRRKPVEILKLQGTYRADRHKQKVENKSLFVDGVVKDVVVPVSIENEIVKEIYKNHLNFLTGSGLIQQVDLAEIEELYITLQHLKKINDEIKNVKIDDDYKKWSELIRVRLKVSYHFSEISKKYLVSPDQRAKLTIEALTIQKMDEEQTIMNKLMKRKRC